MIIEIADPIEIEFDHVTHMEFDHYSDSAERSISWNCSVGLVRQNPDTLFIGEVRDLQSATAAIDMSLARQTGMGHRPFAFMPDHYRTP